MKVIGLTTLTGQNKHITSDGYIVQLSHNELARAFERGYSNAMKPLNVGDELDLSSIPDQRGRVIEATKKMQEAYEQFVKAAPVMAEVARVIGESRATGETT
jgi:hypothetical protein